MPDIADQANDLRDREIDSLVANRASPAVPPGNGRCLHCDEPVEPPRRWCDAGCRDDYEKAQRAEQQKPVA